MSSKAMSGRAGDASANVFGSRGGQSPRCTASLRSQRRGAAHRSVRGERCRQVTIKNIHRRDAAAESGQVSLRRRAGHRGRGAARHSAWPRLHQGDHLSRFSVARTISSMASNHGRAETVRTATCGAPPYRFYGGSEPFGPEDRSCLSAGQRSWSRSPRRWPPTSAYRVREPTACEASAERS